MNLFDLTGKVALITGSSRGIGRAIAEAYADAGAKVVISSRKQAACDEVAARINEKHGAERAIAIAASISDKPALERLVARTRAHFGAIDILVCNAASNPHYGPLLEVSDELFRKIFENNVLSSLWLIAMVAPEMMGRQDGAIVILSSIGGLVGSDVIGAYNISKAADFQLVRNLATELGPHNVRVNAIAPGVIQTDFARSLWEDANAAAELKRTTPLGRIGEPRDIVGAAVLFASRAGSFITGQSLVIDGGKIVNGTV